MKTYRGSCHCGDVRFTTDIDLGRGTIKCNCSICTKMRWWAAVVPPAAFRLEHGGPLGEYRFLAQRDGHYFCKRCGIHTHSTGESPRTGEFVAVAVACLDDVSPEELIAAPVTWLDGRNDAWDAPPAETRHL
jgi:hypothetical protein